MFGLVDDEKPRVILGEYKSTQNLPTKETVLDEKWSLKSFKNRFRVVIVRMEENEMEFDLIGLHPAFANTFRRLMLGDVPTMAFEKVHIFNNTSIMQDEVLVHRLGLIPLQADPRLFEMKSNDSEGTEQDTLEFTLKIKCSNNKDGNKDSVRAEDMYKNNNVYSKHIKWTPIGNQKDKFLDNVGPIHGDILITKMRPGHELDLKLIAVKGIGRDHTKFSPVSTVFYRLLPDVKLLKEVEGDAAERLQKCFSPGVVELRHEKNKKYAIIKDSRYDMGCRNILRHDDLRDSVAMTKIQDHFIFSVESVGALKPEVIFVEAVKILKEKCVNLLEELNCT